MKKFVIIKVLDDETTTVGAIDLGEINYEKSETEISNEIKKTIEPKLIKALSETFNCPVKIRLTDVVSVLGYIEVKTFVVLEMEEEDTIKEIMMHEFWIY